MQPCLLGGGYMGLGEAEFSVSELMEEFLKFSNHAKLPEVVEANQNLDCLRIKRRVHLHIVQDIGETDIKCVAHIVERIGDTPTDVLDRGLRIGNCVFVVIDIVIPIVLPESAGRNPDTESPLHLSLDLCDAILISFIGIA